MMLLCYPTLIHCVALLCAHNQLAANTWHNACNQFATVCNSDTIVLARLPPMLCDILLSEHKGKPAAGLALHSRAQAR